ncbi:hypothetical protein AVEN_204737-1 [Araneus ventricosus]|uniref:Uncharacterized protein n=1 Tax=Araneus ventricosus TaxID=182803 RepID=A0A4Y2L9H2_ARAVE|nr:hypothetical protein AVEN_204737-1 [Araneus ventricosus]
MCPDALWGEISRVLKNVKVLDGEVLHHAGTTFHSTETVGLATRPKVLGKHLQKYSELYSVYVDTFRPEV